MTAPRTGRFSLQLLPRQVRRQRHLESQIGNPNDHIVARGQTGRGQPVTMVIGLPSQLAANTYGGL